jgi:TolB protein
VQQIPTLATILACCLALLLAGCSVGGGATVARVPNRLAYVGLDAQIYNLMLDDRDPRRVSSVPGEAPLPAGRRLTQWPTWSADGSRLAFLRFDLSRVADDVALIFVVAADGSGLTKVFESSEDIPIYLDWSPDGALLAVLAQHQETLRLLLVDPSGAAPPREVATGAPLYFAWSPDAKALLLHTNGDYSSHDAARLSLARSEGDRWQTEELPARPGNFRAPAWSSDGGTMAFVAQLPGGQATLAVQAVGAAEPTRLTIVGDEPSLLWSPSGDRLAFGSRVAGRPLLHHGLETIKPDGSDRRRVTDDNLAAFYWSPDGKHLAYAGVDTANRSFAWYVVDPDGKNRRQVASFLPSDEQIYMFTYFDQYAQSHGVWSPDGKYLLYAGSPPGTPRPRQGTGPADQDADTTAEPPQVYVVPTDGSAAPRSVVNGGIALWPVAVPAKQ